MGETYSPASASLPPLPQVARKTKAVSQVLEEYQSIPRGDGEWFKAHVRAAIKRHEEQQAKEQREQAKNVLANRN